MKRLWQRIVCLVDRVVFAFACVALVLAAVVFAIVMSATLAHALAWTLQWAMDLANWWGDSLTWPEFMRR